VSWEIVHGDCIEVMREMPDNSIDSICTDPPYGLGFMGKQWDSLPPGKEWGEECLRVLKPGGHLLAFGGSRTSHRLTVAIEDAGFSIRDSIIWLYFTGFPKSMDLARAIDKRLGGNGTYGEPKSVRHALMIQEGHTGTGQNEGWDRPWKHDAEAVEQYAREYLPETDEGKQWKGWASALKPAHEPIIVARKPVEGTLVENVLKHGTGGLNIAETKVPVDSVDRWPANVVVDEMAAEELDAVFFYCAKPDTPERNAGLSSENEHPTVKPVSLMEWLIKLVTPPGGTVLDPFCGSGTTGCAAVHLHPAFSFVGIERDEPYVQLARQRIAHWEREPVQIGLFD
jgi:DNA modification methylase